MDVYVFICDVTDYHTEHGYAFTTIELLDKSVQITYSKLGKITRVGNEYFLNVNEPAIGRVMKLAVMTQPDHI